MNHFQYQVTYQMKNNESSSSSVNISDHLEVIDLIMTENVT